MDKLKESQLTQRASRRPCEYNYTNADIARQNAQPSDGYQFEYPVNWTGDPSRNKVIGLRRINYIPTVIRLSFQIVICYDDTPGSTQSETIPITGYYTSENTFEEILGDIDKKIHTQLIADSLEETIFPHLPYDKFSGKFGMNFVNDDETVAFKFSFAFPGDIDYSSEADFNNTAKTYYKRELLKLFNQEITPANVQRLFDFNNDYFSVDNVWNRDTFYCHASFSDSPRKIIGINKDFWTSPSVFYEYSDNSNDFNVYFTTDTVQRILPRNGVLLIQISYIFNYQTSYLTY